jgi:hypothetical protein
LQTRTTTSRRPARVAALAAALALTACTNSGAGQEGTNQTPAISGRSGASDENPVGGAPDQTARTRASQAGSIGPGSAVSTSNVNPNRDSTQTQVDTTPDLRPNAGPGSE